jgi:aldose 1-epimerase
MSAADTPQLLALQAGALHLHLAPAVGGSIARFFSQHGEQAHHWLRPASEAALDARLPLKMGSFPLVPFCNRIRNGRSSFGALPVELPPNYRDSPHTLHGTAWLAPWQVGEASATHAVLHYRHAPAHRHEWPYAFRAEQRFELSPQRLAVTLAVHNEAPVPMPTGIGQHPYFPRTPRARIRTQVEGLWEGDAEAMPTQHVAAPWLRRFQDGLPLSEVVLDNNFTGWSRAARVDWPETGTWVEMHAEAPFDHFVVYCPPPAHEDGSLFCMEPVSNCTDWMNLTQAGVGPVGGTLLAPGESLEGRFTLTPGGLDR